MQCDLQWCSMQCDRVLPRYALFVDHCCCYCYCHCHRYCHDLAREANTRQTISILR